MHNIMKNISRIIISSLLLISICLSLHADSRQCVWKDVDRIIAVGDIHGDYDNFVMILKSAELVDDKLRWSGGKTHFVQIGDILDRGDHAREVLDLLMRLQKEAEEAGGKVHILLGNHEEMNITGIVFRYDYVTPKQFVSFLPDDLRQKKENKFRRQLLNLAEVENNSDPTLMDNYLETKWRGLIKDKNLQRSYVDTFNSKYGRWLLEQNVVIKINDIIFSHGGISERYSKWPIQKINDVLLEELDVFRLAHKRGITPNIRRKVLYMPDSPLWNRDFSLKDEESYSPIVDKILKNLGANFMVIAHTPPGSAVIPQDEFDPVYHRFNQRIHLIDTGISEYYHSMLSYLRIEGGKFDLRVWLKEEYAEEAQFEPSEVSSEEESREDVEYYLTSASVVGFQKEAVPGRTAAAKVSLDDGEIKKYAMFKTIDTRRPEPLPDSYRYELAAYALDKLLDFGRIPPMVEREIRGTKGSLQVRVEDCFGLDEQQRKNIDPPDPEAFAIALGDINVFENLVYKERDELDDILIQGKTWMIYRVDFGEAFDPTPDLIPEQKITRCSQTLYHNLQELSDKVIKVRLSDYLNDEEMSALLSRKALIIKILKELIEAKGEAAVLH
jgi:hypothetical protein